MQRKLGKCTIIAQETVRAGVKANGVFGWHTLIAVVKFQRAHHLRINGVVNRKMYAALCGGEQQQHKKSECTEVLRLGSHGDCVKYVQRKLGELL